MDPCTTLQALNLTYPCPSRRVSWQSTPEKRGTLNIIWTCASTLVLCLWTMLHLNVPAATDGRRTRFLRKLRWFCLGILAPELPMLFACGQYASAKRSVAEFTRAGYAKHRWTLTHGWYADSGGFVLVSSEMPTYPVTAKQLAYLVRHGYVEMPEITQREIQDKSKAGGLTKWLAFFQSGYLLALSIYRMCLSLPVTPLELSTLALACTSLTTLGFWWQKPLDVRTPTTLRTQYSLSNLPQKSVKGEGLGFPDMPLDFIEPQVYMSRKWSRQVFRCICWLRLQERQLTRIPNDRDPQATFRQHCLLALGTATFASMHLLGWNFDFGSTWQRQVWHVSSGIVWGLLCVYGCAEMAMCHHEGYSLPGLESGAAYKMRWPQCLLFFVPASAYLLARIGLLVVALCSMASLPESAYDTVRWSAVG